MRKKITSKEEPYQQPPRDGHIPHLTIGGRSWLKPPSLKKTWDSLASLLILKYFKHFTLILLTFIVLGVVSVSADAQSPLALHTRAIFEQHCIDCHGANRPFSDVLTVEPHDILMASGTVVPGNPDASEFYKRLLGGTADGARMPLNKPPLTDVELGIVRRWIEAGAPNWVGDPPPPNFITPDAMLTAMQQHVNSLAPFDRPFARYFTMTHLYNAGETADALAAYRRALSKLINSLSWGYDVTQPQPIDAEETLFYIDLRHYEWDVNAAWAQIEDVYPYAFDYGNPVLYETLQQEMACEVPFVQVDWFLATASLPPLYHGILDLPETARELETRLEVNVARNLQDAPGVRVWRAGFNESRVSQNNRVVERHRSRYGAYWKSYDFAGNVGNQNVFTHPLSFKHDGGEIIFNLPNGLQAYFLVTAAGTRLDEAPVDIVSNPAARDPVVRNGLSCIGCHTEGMKEFEDGVREVILQQVNPPYDKEQALRLYVEQAEMEKLLAEDTQRFRTALEAAGGIFGGIEPVERFHQRFEEPLDVAHAAASVGLTPSAFQEEIRNGKLQGCGLESLLLANGRVQRDTWTSQFANVVTRCTPLPPRFWHIPDLQLRAVIHKTLGKPQNVQLTKEEAPLLRELRADRKGIRDLTGLELATNLERLELRHNLITDIAPLQNLTRLGNIKLRDNLIVDVSPLEELRNVGWLGLEENRITDLSPLSDLTKLDGLGINGNPVSDISAVSGMLSLSNLQAWDTGITDISPLASSRKLETLAISGGSISDVTPLAGLPALRELAFEHCGISDLTSFAKLTGVRHLNLRHNAITDVSPLAGLRNLEHLDLHDNEITDFSALEELREKTNVILTENPGFRSGGPKITGPWLWVLVPGTRLNSRTDFLAQASGGDVTELKVATTGATEGKAVGESKWRAHRLSATGADNINNMTASLGWGRGEDIYEHIVYGSILLDAPLEQQTTMFVGSDDAVKVWLNGELVHQALVIRWANDYQDFFPVTLKQGKNVLLVAVDNHGHGGFSGFFGFAPDAKYALFRPSRNFSFSTDATELEVGDTFTLQLDAANVTDLTGWQAELVFNPAVLKVTQVLEGDFLKQNDGETFFQEGTIQNRTGNIIGLKSVQLSRGKGFPNGTLLSVDFTVIGKGKSLVTLENFQAGTRYGKILHVTPPELSIVVGSQDVNGDGSVNILDLTLIAARFGQRDAGNPADVNGDGLVNVADLVLVAGALGGAAGGAPAVEVQVSHTPTAATVQQWLAQAQAMQPNGTDAKYQRGIVFLQRLLAALTPKQTALLPNYPNPFNPETWIPYQLSVPAEVSVSIYAANGKLVRMLDFGHQPAGIYHIRGRAAYWDGRNSLGERVASGVYFYTFTAGDFTATRKMLVVK